jgi:hypothetical protein
MPPKDGQPFSFRIEGNAAIFPAYWQSATTENRLVWQATFTDPQRIFRNETVRTIIVDGCRLQARFFDIQTLQERFSHSTGRMEILSGVDADGNPDPTWNPFD